jgi:hypothetical protein
MWAGDGEHTGMRSTDTVSLDAEAAGDDDHAVLR